MPMGMYFRIPLLYLLVKEQLSPCLYFHVYNRGHCVTYRRGVIVARSDCNGQFLGPQAVERVTDRVSTSFFISVITEFLFLIDFLETASLVL